MTRPSELLEAMRATLELELRPPGAPTLERPLIGVSISDDISEDVAGRETVPDPGVVLSCTGLSGYGDSYSATLVRAEFIARCYARIAEGPDDADGSRGDVAMDLAALVAMIVERTIWLGPDGKPMVLKRAERIDIHNRTVRGTTSEGRALWVVRWQQQLELTQRDASAALHAFRKLHITYAMGDANTPDEEAHIEMPGGTP